MSKSHKNPSAGTPAWKQAQQKQTEPKNNDQRAAEAKKPADGMVKLKMKSDYRDVAKSGQVWETDAEKAAELVRLGRAEYVKAPKAPKAPEQTGSDAAPSDADQTDQKPTGLTDEPGEGAE